MRVSVINTNVTKAVANYVCQIVNPYFSILLLILCSNFYDSSICRPDNL